MNETLRHPWVGAVILVLFLLDFWVGLGLLVWWIW